MDNDHFTKPSVSLKRQILTATVSFLAGPEDELCLISDTDMRIDKEFYEYTPLYTPDGDVEAEVIAITGLAGHAFGSWAASQHHMCLRDFLPRDFPRTRTLLYGYDSYCQPRSIIAGFTNNFIAKLLTMRSQSRSESRPIVFCWSQPGLLDNQSSINRFRILFFSFSM